MNRVARNRWEILALRWMLLIYILLCLIIAGLNYGYAPGADPSAARIVNSIWHFYENGFKTAMILFAAVLSLRLSRQKDQHQILNIRAMAVSAVFLHILAPALLGSKEVYFYSMPFPWTSLPIRVWAPLGMTALIGFYLVWSVIILSGTLLIGRKWQCSMVCMFNGFTSILFEPAFPVMRRKRKKVRKMPGALARNAMLAISIVFFLTQWLAVFGLWPEFASWMAAIETFKYLILELLMAMLFWLILHGRGYCAYCPLGTMLSVVSSRAGQRIKTDEAVCVGCGKCDSVCPMGIDIMKQARLRKPVQDSRCVGCGLCVDVCPAKTLTYMTHFLKWYQRKESSRQTH